ncbi:uncharacterized protein [Diadema setosum]|uniref:uncharacterized protein n=1 Tax=Diadema setosum TaxID=31175 RepID=UPI003B3A0C55
MVPSQVLVSTCKRKRGPNWSEKEKKVLVDEYRKRRHILRPKGPGLTTVVDRETAWDEISTALKVVSGPYIKRDVVDVRKKWDNLCFWAKKCIAEWKDKGSAADSSKRLNGENAPPALALKILSIYQDEWSDIFPNAHVVDGGDVFFVLNNDNPSQAELQLVRSLLYNKINAIVFRPSFYKVCLSLFLRVLVQEERAANYPPDLDNRNDGTGDVYEVIDPQRDDVVKTEEGGDDRWPQEMPPDEDGFPQYPTEATSKEQPPVSHALQPPPSRYYFQLHQSMMQPPCSGPSSPMEDCLPQEPSHMATTMAQSDGSHFRPYSFQSAASLSSSCLNPPPPQHSMPHSGASPAYKRRRYSSAVAEDSAHSDIDDEKDIETLSKDLLILRKQKLVLEKEKLEIEKEKLVIERDILDMQRERQWLQLEKARAEQPNARPSDMTANHVVINKTTEHLASD